MTKPNGSQASNYFADFERIRHLLSDFYTPMEVQEWLTSNHKLLGDQSPTQLIAEGKANEVEQLIEQLRDGAFL